MYYKSGQKVRWNKKTYTIKEITGLYSCGQVSIVLTNDKDKTETQMNYTREFYPLVQSGKIVDLFQPEKSVRRVA